MSKFADFWGRPSDSSFFDHHHFVFQAVFGGEIFFSQQIFWIFGAPASEMHTITEYNSPDLWTFCKSYGGAQKRCVYPLFLSFSLSLYRSLSFHIISLYRYLLSRSYIFILL